MTCKTCSNAVLTHVAECSLKDDDGNYIHPGGLCPEQLTCSHWVQGDAHEIFMNSIDWSSAAEIDID